MLGFILLSKLFWFYDSEDTGDVEAKVDVAFWPTICCLANECALGHAGGIGEHKLEYVAAGFDVDADRSVVVRFTAIIKHVSVIEPVIIFAGNGYAATNFYPATNADGKCIVVLRGSYTI